ncbi:MAG TPA: S53 family peptidase [Streptosporangiaceae bacterium]
MPVTSIVRLSPHAAMRAGHRPRRLSQAAALAAAATLIACLAAGCASAAPGRPARAATAGSAGTAAVDGPVLCGPPDYFIQCYTPGQYQVAYGVAPLLKRGITGKGETVVMPELANRPGPNYTDIRKDLAAFDRKFGLPTAQLKVTTTLAGASAPYVAGHEEVEDTEIVHAIAPAATLDVVLVPANATASAANFTAAVTGTIHAAITQHAAVVSISGSHGEHLFTPAQVARLHAALQQAADGHVTVVASSGDTGVISDKGPPEQVSLPASDPLVLGVGGTALNASFATGAYQGEMAWNADTSASAGGYSYLFRRPSYQDGVSRIGHMRGVPDVAADADSSTAMTLTFTGGVPYPAQGTSAATPLWAAVIALADQDAGQHLGFVNPAIYAIARSPAYHRAFHDAVTGDNSVFWPTRLFTGYQAGPGWDPVTGWGSPNAQTLVPLLADTARHGGTPS